MSVSSTARLRLIGLLLCVLSMQVTTVVLAQSRQQRTTQPLYVPDKTQRSFGSLVRLIRDAQSMNMTEKQEWIDLLPKMQRDQRDALERVLLKEKRDLERINEEYLNAFALKSYASDASRMTGTWWSEDQESTLVLQLHSIQHTPNLDGSFRIIVTGKEKSNDGEQNDKMHGFDGRFTTSKNSSGFKVDGKITSVLSSSKVGEELKQQFVPVAASDIVFMLDTSPQSDIASERSDTLKIKFVAENASLHPWRGEARTFTRMEKR